MVDISREHLQRLVELRLNRSQYAAVIEIINQILEKKNSSRGSCLPQTWAPSESDVDYGRGLGFTDGQITHQAESMRLWADANRHRPVARKSDWHLTFKGWLRRARERMPRAQVESKSYMEIADDLRRGMR